MPHAHRLGLSDCVSHCLRVQQMPVNISQNEEDIAERGESRTGTTVSSEMSSIGTLDRNRSDQRRLRALSPRNAVWLESNILARSRRWMKTICGALETDWRHHREHAMSSSWVYVSANRQIRAEHTKGR